MMDMVIHDDGHSNIESHDALDAYNHFDLRKDIKPEKYSLVLTNPPFGAVVKDERILNDFELGRGKDRQRTEVLFIERCLALLKPGGRLGIVLPDGILTNTSLQYVRDFILKKAKILAIVSLPQTAFIPAGSGVKASLLFLRKKDNEKENREYHIFMAIVEHIGYDATGRPDENDFPQILADYRKYLKGNIN
jgi:type I restriction enzyme M protein